MLKVDVRSAVALLLRAVLAFMQQRLLMQRDRHYDYDTYGSRIGSTRR